VLEKRDLEVLDKKVEEWLHAARQAGKSENSGLVDAMIKMLKEYDRIRSSFRERILLFFIAVLIVIYLVSAWYVFATQVTQKSLDTAVANSMENYLELEGYNDI